MKTLDKLLTSILAVTLVFSVLSVANPYYFVVGPSAYAENDDEEKSNSDHGSNDAHDSDREEHDDNDECNPEDDVDEEAEDEEVNEGEDETSNEEEENDDGSESDEAEEDEESSGDVNDEEEVDEQDEENDVDEQEEESDEEENEVEDESEQEEGDSEDAAEDEHNEGQETEEQEAEDETEDEQNDLEEVDEDECNNEGRSDNDEGQVTQEEIKEKHKERIQDIVTTTSGTQIHERHMNAEPMSVGEYAPGLAYSLTAAGVAEHGGVHTVEVDMDIAVWKSNSAIVLMDVLGGTVTVEGHAYTVAIGYGLYSTHSDMIRVSALVVDEGTGDVFKLKLRGNAIGEDVQLPMNASEALDLSFEGNSGPSKNEFAGAELDLEGAITAA